MASFLENYIPSAVLFATIYHLLDKKRDEITCITTDDLQEDHIVFTKKNVRKPFELFLKIVRKIDKCNVTR